MRRSKRVIPLILIAALLMGGCVLKTGTTTHALATALPPSTPTSATFPSPDTPTEPGSSPPPQNPASPSSDLPSPPPGAERELARFFVDDPNGECGWEVLEETENTSYVWAICQSPRGTAVSAPVVLFWEIGRRTLTKIQMPRDGSFYGQDVRQLFPAKVEERILDHDVNMDAIWEQIERDLPTVTGTVVKNAASVRVVTLEDEGGKQWHVPWGASAGVRWSDDSRAQFRDLGRGMMVEVVGFPRPEAATPNALTAVRVTIRDEN